MFAVGGWRQGSTGFAEITKNKENRLKFSNKVVAFLRENDLDGIELNWQHPTLREGGKPEDKQNYVFLAQVSLSALIYIYIYYIYKEYINKFLL